MIQETITAEKKRHGCLTAYLVFMMIVNSGTALVYLIGADAIQKNLPNIMPDWFFPVLIIGGVFNLICAIALFKWKKWGFWGFTASACATFAMNLYFGLGIASAASGLIGIAILFGVLQIGNDNKGWAQLE